MKHILFILFVAFTFTAYSQIQISKETLQNNINTNVLVCGIVKQSTTTTKGVTYLNINDSYPSNLFSVVVFKKDLANFPEDINKYYTNQSICVNGKLTKYYERYQIIANDNLQIEIIKGE